MSRAAGPGLPEEARFELAMTASAQEKRNRPVALVALAALVLIAGAVFAVTGFTARATAHSARLLAVSDALAVEQMEQEWKELERLERDAPLTGFGAPMPNLLTQMEQMATSAGLKDKPANPNTSTQNLPGIVVTEYAYRAVKDHSLAALMQWIRQATSQVPGMEVTELRLKPEATAWSMDVTYRRWERAK